MKNGPSLPGWAIGLILAVFIVAIVGVGYKYISGSGPLPESQYPKEAFTPPGYSNPGNPTSTGSNNGAPGYGGTSLTPEQAAERGR